MTDMKLSIWCTASGFIQNGAIVEITGTRGFTWNSVEYRLNSIGTRSSVAFDTFPYWSNSRISIFNKSKQSIDMGNQLIYHLRVNYVQEAISVIVNANRFNGTFKIILESPMGYKYFEQTITGTAT